MSWIRDLTTRRQPRPSWRRVLLGALGGAIVIAVLGLASELTGSVLLAASFAASCVLVFSVPETPLAQPVNLVAGHLVSTAIGLLAHALLPTQWWSVALAVGLAIGAMAALRVTHPPAGANAVVVMTIGANWWYLLAPILIGALVVVVIGVAFHRVTGTTYPIRGAA